MCGIIGKHQLPVEELLAQKATATEKTAVARPAAVVAFLAAEFAAGQAAREGLPVQRTTNLAHDLDALFQALLRGAFGQ